MVGIDGGGLDDLLGLTIIGRGRYSRKYLAWSHAWAHKGVLDRRQSEAAEFRDFEKDGDLTIFSEMGDDLTELVDYVSRIRDAGRLSKIGIDPLGVGQIVEALAAIGVAGDDKVIGIPQGYQLQGAIKTAERKLVEGTLIHCPSKLMNYCVGNARVEPKGNAIVITKQAAGTKKIDPLMAMFDAIALMSRDHTEPSIYTPERGLMSVG